MKKVYYLLVLVLILFLATSCEKDKKSAAYNFSSMREVEEFMEDHDWIFSLDCYEDTDYPGQMVIWFWAEWLSGGINPYDDFTLSINGKNVSVYYDDYYDELDHSEIIIPIASSVKVIFKRNNKTLFNKDVSIPAFPKITSFPDYPDWTKDNTLKWRLSRDSHFQVIFAETENYYSYKEKTYVVTPSARSYVIPANALYMQNIYAYDITIDEVNFTEYENNLALAITYDYIWEDDDYKNADSQRDRKARKFTFRNKHKNDLSL